MKRPDSSEYLLNSLFSYYIDLVPDQDITDLLQQQLSTMLAIFGNLSSKQASYRYADDKWSPKQILGHITDAEQVFAYYALYIARGETKPLGGFESNDYITSVNFEEQSLADLIERFRHVRLASIALAKSLPVAIQSRLTASMNVPFSPRAFFSIMVGHVWHHLGILKERYHIG